MLQFIQPLLDALKKLPAGVQLFVIALLMGIAATGTTTVSLYHDGQAKDSVIAHLMQDKLDLQKEYAQNLVAINDKYYVQSESIIRAFDRFSYAFENRAGGANTAPAQQRP
jgi:hypothetical protein